MSTPPKEFKHSMGRRNFNHDYRKRQYYHITLRKTTDSPSFSRVVGDPTNPEGHPNEPRAILSPLGVAIEKEILNLAEINPLLRVYDHVLMPDHVHFILLATEKLERHVGYDLATMKVNCNKQLYVLFPELKEKKVSVFMRKYVDVEILRAGQLEVEKKYIRTNPRRLQIMRKYPDFFTRNITFEIETQPLLGFGNPFLLMKRFRFQVMCRSFWTDEQFEKYRQECLELTKRGGIAVSPFYSPREKVIYNDIVTLGGEIIILSMVAYSDRSKPQGRQFELCSEGKLLIVYERDAPLYRKHIDRKTAMRLNNRSELIASQPAIYPRLNVGK